MNESEKQMFITDVRTKYANTSGSQLQEEAIKASEEAGFYEGKRAAASLRCIVLCGMLANKEKDKQ